MESVTSEIVEIFWEDGKPIGFLLMNGHAEFFKVSKASKEHVRERFLGIGNTPPAVEESVTPLK